MESIQDKLRSLGVNVGTERIETASARKNRFPLEEIVEGYIHRTLYGDAFITLNNYSQNYIHGSIKLEAIPDLDLISLWAKAPKLSNLDMRKFVFLDTETSGLSGGTGTLVFMVGLGFYDNNGFQTKQLFLKNPEAESSLLASLDELVTPFEVVVTYNGKSFDVPMINSRYVINGLQSPFNRFEHIDLLHLARRLWRKRIPSRTLGNIEKEIIGFSRTEEDVPGWMAPEIYFNYLRDGDARPLKNVFYHNAMDVLSLATLLIHISNLLSKPLQLDDIHSIDLTEIASLYEELGYVDFAALLYEQCINQELPMTFFIETLHRYATLHRRKGEWDLAEGLWIKAAEKRDIAACIELSKYYEHQVKDYHKAAHWSLKGLELIDEAPVKAYEKMMIGQSIQHRLQRLGKKKIKSE